MRQKFNLHTHTTRCNHAVGHDEQYILAAIEAGFTTIGFSEHIPFPNCELPQDRMLNERVDEYIETMYKYKEKYASQIRILVGLEIEYYEEQDSYLQSMRKRVDYMIVGQHYKYYTGYNYDHYNSDEDVLLYAKQIAQALDAKLTRYVAHPDYFMLGRRTFTPACKQAVQIIIDALLRNDGVAELNLNGLRYGKMYYKEGIQYAYPNAEIFKMFSEAGVKVCFGYDAHHPATLLEQGREATCLNIIQHVPLHFVEDVNECIV